MVDIKHLPGFATVRTGARCSIGIENTVAEVFPEDLVEQVATIDLEPYVLMNGRPMADTEHGARINLDGGSTSEVVSRSAPMPEDLDLGTWRRWLPYAEWMSAPGGGTRRWFPIETDPAEIVAVGSGPSGVPQPRTALYTSVDPALGGVAADGRGDYVANVSPHIDESYSYQGYSQEMFRNAMVFSGAGHLSIETEQTFTETTFGIVAVFHPSDNPHYGIFASNEVDPYVGTPGEPLVLRYSHGRLEMYQAHVRVLSHEMHRSSHQAAIILVSLSASTDTGRALIIDRTRTTRAFNIDNLDFVSFGGMIGAEGQATVGDPVQMTADMDVLEMAIWDTSMDFGELEEKANLLCLAYGIAG